VARSLCYFTAVNRRFQIEDLIVQDSSGVVFRAIDQETQLPVAVRRLFPFGVNGGGLDESEQELFEIALDKILNVKHAALRGILLGGTDPVDGLPYVATEWVDGATLQSFVDRGPLSPAEATFLITQALEVCQLLSQALGRESVWVETDLSTIVVGAAETGRGFTFWVSPLKCIGKNDGQRGLEPIVALVEQVMGWRGKAVVDQDGGGLGAWLKWLRLTAVSATLNQAREKLAESLGTAAPSPVRRAVRQAERSGPPKKATKKSNFPAIFATISGFGVLALGGFLLVRWNESKQPVTPPPVAESETAAVAEKPTKKKKPAAVVEEEALKVSAEAAPDVPKVPVKIEPPPETPVVMGETPEEKASRLAAAFTDIAHQESTAKETKAAAQKVAVAAKGGTFTIADSELLATQEGTQVSLEGTLVGLKKSGTGKTLYLLFSEKAANGEVRGSILTNGAGADLSEESLAPLIGKSLRISGEIFLEPNFGKERPNVVIRNRASIELK
jgi:hypothetical protein